MFLVSTLPHPSLHNEEHAPDHANAVVFLVIKALLRRTLPPVLSLA